MYKFPGTRDLAQINMILTGKKGQIPVQKTDMISPPPTTSIHIKYDDSWANSNVHASSTACFCLLHCGIYAGTRQSSPTFQQFQIWARKRHCSNAFIRRPHLSPECIQSCAALLFGSTNALDQWMVVENRRELSHYRRPSNSLLFFLLPSL